jgi:hypothetical protein
VEDGGWKASGEWRVQSTKDGGGRGGDGDVEKVEEAKEAKEAEEAEEAEEEEEEEDLQWPNRSRSPFSDPSE